MTYADIKDLETRDYIFKIGDRGKGIQARYDENTDALIFPRAAFDYVYKLLNEALSAEPCIYDLKNRYCPRLNEHGMLKYPLQEQTTPNKPKQKSEPCDDDDGVDHEKIRKAFAKESDIKKADIADMVTKVIMQAEEETDRFIFNTIRPYCEEITQQEISKEILSKALTQYFSKPTECDDAISRDAVMNEVKCWIGSGEYRYTNATDYLSKRIRELPPVTPSRRKGHWGKTGQSFLNPNKFRNFCCTECLHELDEHIRKEPKYCPNCGADNESEE